MTPCATPSYPLASRLSSIPGTTGEGLGGTVGVSTASSVPSIPPRAAGVTNGKLVILPLLRLRFYFDLFVWPSGAHFRKSINPCIKNSPPNPSPAPLPNVF